MTFYIGIPYSKHTNCGRVPLPSNEGWGPVKREACVVTSRIPHLAPLRCVSPHYAHPKNPRNQRPQAQTHAITYQSL
ncbi:hypothetical protein BDZ97DRAFT_1806746 [Flammula alnicola]|nr:hypothetical protein BDZ97DRAFT_1806746 [Flammula alnicola]